MVPRNFAIAYHSDVAKLNDDEYEDLIRHIADNIKELRQRSGYTQLDMESMTSIDIKNYQRLESGKHHFSLHTLFRLARAFECQIEDLVNEPTKEKKSRLKGKAK